MSSASNEPEGAADGRRGRLSRFAPWAALAAAAALAALVAPPSSLGEIIGSDVWTRLALGVIVFFAIFAVLAALGVTDGKVGLPGGLMLESAGRHGLGASPALAERLAALEAADERIFECLHEAAELLQDCSERLEALERWRA